MLPLNKGDYDMKTYDVKSTISAKIEIQTNNKVVIRLPKISLPYRVDFYDSGIPSNIPYDEDTEDIIIEMRDLRVFLLPDNLPRSK